MIFISREFSLEVGEVDGSHSDRKASSLEYVR